MSSAPAPEQPPARAELRRQKAELKKAKRERREAIRRHNTALALAQQTKAAAATGAIDPALQEAAAQAAALAEAAPLPDAWRELVQDTARIRASQLASLAVGKLLQQRPLTAGGEQSGSKETANELLRAMKAGTQELRMFDDSAALDGYVRRKFAPRALLVFSGLRNAYQLPWAAQSLTRVKRVVSIGGGPACCLLGWCLFEYIVLGRKGSIVRGDEADGDASADAHVGGSCCDDRGICDFDGGNSGGSGGDGGSGSGGGGISGAGSSEVVGADGGTVGDAAGELLCLDLAAAQWRMWIETVDTVLLGGMGRLRGGFVDVTHAWEQVDQAVRAVLEQAQLLLFSYVLTETRDQWHDFVTGLFAQVRRPSPSVCVERIFVTGLFAQERRSSPSVCVENLRDTFSPLARLAMPWTCAVSRERKSRA